MSACRMAALVSARCSSGDLASSAARALQDRQGGQGSLDGTAANQQPAEPELGNRCALGRDPLSVACARCLPGMRRTSWKNAGACVRRIAAPHHRRETHASVESGSHVDSLDSSSSLLTAASSPTRPTPTARSWSQRRGRNLPHHVAAAYSQSGFDRALRASLGPVRSAPSLRRVGAAACPPARLLHDEQSLAERGPRRSGAADLS